MRELRNPDCDKCNLHKGCDNICQMGFVNKGGKSLMVIGDYPSVSDIYPLGESKFDLFWQIAKTVCGVDESRVYSTYVAKCNPKDKKPTTEQNLTCASTYIKKEILAVRPKAILLLGVAAGSVFGFGEHLNKAGSNIKEVTFGRGDDKFTVTIVYTYSPTYVQYNDHLLKKFAFDIDKAWKVASGITEETELPTRVILCTTLDEVRQVIEYIQETGQCTFDFETTKLTDMNVYDPDFKATLLAVCFQHGSAYTIPLFHFDSPFTEEEVVYILQLFSSLVWNNPLIHKINQNIKFDMHVAARYGFDKFSGRCDCTMVMHSLYDDLTKHGIKEWIPTFFPKFIGWELEIKGNDWAKIPLKTLSNYAGIDADAAFRGYTVLTQKLLEDERVYDLYRNLYAFALKPLFHMECRGMLISREDILKYEDRALQLIGEQTKKMNKYIQVHSFNQAEGERIALDKLNELRQKRTKAIEGNRLKYAAKVLILINDIKSGRQKLYSGINFGSPDQLCKLLYSSDSGFKFKPPYNKTSRGPKESTGEVEVKSLPDKTGFIQDLLVLRSIQGTYSKYLKGMRELMDENDRVHTTYSQARVKTGRLSSTSPNLQNISSHIKIKHPFVEEVTVMAKKIFTVPDGYTLLNFDFSQAELRMIAEFAVAAAMIEAYNANKDLHAVTASSIVKKTFDEFMLMSKAERDPLRQKGKSANFGLVFDISIEGFRDYSKNAYGIDMSLAEATYVYEAFFALYPEIQEYHQIYRGKCRKYGYVRTLFGRCGHYPDIHSTDSFKRGNAERECINFPIQGSNAENTTLALALLEHRLPSTIKLYNTIHDSIMAMVPNHLVPYAVKVGVRTCENTPMLRFFGKEMIHLKMKADCQYSLTNWKDLKDYTLEAWQEDLAKQ